MTTYRLIQFGIPALGILLELTHFLHWYWIAKIRNCEVDPPDFLVRLVFDDEKADYIRIGRFYLRHVWMILLAIGIATWIVPSFWLMIFVGRTTPAAHDGIILSLETAGIYMMILLFSMVPLFQYKEAYCNHQYERYVKTTTSTPVTA